MEQGHGASDEPPCSFVILRPCTAQAAGRSNFIMFNRNNSLLHCTEKQSTDYLLSVELLLFPQHSVCLGQNVMTSHFFPRSRRSNNGRGYQLSCRCSFCYKVSRLTYFALARIDPWSSHVSFIPTQKDCWSCEQEMPATVCRRDLLCRCQQNLELLWRY